MAEIVVTIAARPPIGASQITSQADSVARGRNLDVWATAYRRAAVSRLSLAVLHQHEYSRLDNEFAGLRASQSWLLLQPDEASATLLFSYIKVLAPYLRQRGFAVELLDWCEGAMRACAKIGQNLGWLLLIRGNAQSALGRWGDAVTSLMAAIGASSDTDPHTHARATLSLGQLQFNQGDYRTAMETLSRAERLLAELADYEGLAGVRAEEAAFYLNRRELGRALSLYLAADQLRKRAGAVTSSDHTLLMLGVTHRKMRNYKRAYAYLRQLLERGETRHDRLAIATAAHHLAWVQLAQGRFVQARHLCGRSIALYGESGDRRGISDAYEQLGLIALADGDGNEALSYMKQSLGERRQIGNQQGVASVLRRIANAYLASGQWADAAHALWQSLAIYRHLGMLSRQRLAAISGELLYWVLRGISIPSTKSHIY